MQRVLRKRNNYGTVGITETCHDVIIKCRRNLRQADFQKPSLIAANLKGRVVDSSDVYYDYEEYVLVHC